MKKPLLILCSFLFVSTADAQSWSAGAFVGFGHSYTTEPEPALKHTFKPAINAGISVSRNTKSHWAYGAELSVSREGYDTKEDFYLATYNITTTYLRFTPKGYYLFGKGGNIFRPFIALAGTVGYKLAERVEANFRLIEVYTNPNEFRKFDFGMQPELGTGIKLSKRVGTILSASYSMGFINAVGATGYNRNMRMNAGIFYKL